jgi:AraC-like DNA-binding protein
LRELRIIKACHLLREDCKIEGVARALRFRHLPDFTLEFRKMVGISPSEYKRRERERSAVSPGSFLLWIQLPCCDFILSIFPNVLC